MYKNAMIGTIFSVTAAILFTPPKNTNPAKTATTIPVITRGTWNEFWNASPIELD